MLSAGIKLILPLLLPLAPSSPNAAESGAAPFKKALIRIPDRATSDEVYQFKMDGSLFRVPIRYLATYFENSEDAPDEVVGGFTIFGIWPGFEWKTKDNVQEIGKGTAQSNLIIVTINRNCTPAMVRPVRPAKCVPPERMQSLYSSFGRIGYREFVPATANDARQGPVAQIPGMTYEGFVYKSNEPGAIRPDHLVYRGWDAKGQMEFATCSPQIKPYAHNCVMRLAWRDRFNLKINIRGGLLPEWPAIRTAVLVKFGSFVIEKDMPPPAGFTIKYFP